MFLFFNYWGEREAKPRRDRAVLNLRSPRFDENPTAHEVGQYALDAHSDKISDHVQSIEQRPGAGQLGVSL